MTVSRAFKQNSSINNATKEKIQAAADELGYIFNSTAAAFSSNKTGFIAVTVPSINNANFAETLSGLADGLANSGLQILLGHTGYSLKEEERIIEEFLQKRPEAFIVTGGYHTPRCEKLLKSSGIPVIELWDIPNDPIDEVVGFSNAKAASLIAEHFVELGYTKIGFIGGDADRDTRGLDRRKGFLQKLQSYDLDTTRLVSSGPPPISMR
ncbi:MAG: LacI family DNA-binding transcriptional regulator, partial [Nitratireductor sp.]